jgi:hypothetical protein
MEMPDEKELLEFDRRYGEVRMDVLYSTVPDRYKLDKMRKWRRGEGGSPG